MQGGQTHVVIAVAVVVKVVVAIVVDFSELQSLVVVATETKRFAKTNHAATITSEYLTIVENLSLVSALYIENTFSVNAAF